MDRTDPRLEWLVAQAARWRRANEKTLVFVAHRETLEMLRDALSARAQLASGVFHEELSAARRDTEVARFRADDGPSLLVSTEAGGEGRNFEFCHRLVLYDLPWKPSTVEQRIGRLDRIGRRMPGRDRLLPSRRRHRRRRRPAVRAARAVPRADRRRRAAARPRRARARGRSRSIRTRRCPTRTSSGSSPRRRRRARASTRRPTSSCIASRIAPSSARRSSPAFRPASTR